MMERSSVLGFPETIADLARQTREAELDHEAFAMPLKVCDLGRCKATCCHDGAWLGDEEAAVIQRVIDDFGGELQACGWSGAGVVREGRRWRTEVVEASALELADDFPGHFPRTRCGFLNAEHHCVLQSLAQKQGRHPWHWKPVSCWLHPLLLSRPGGRPRLTLARAGQDPSAHAGYPGFGSCTPCGMPSEGAGRAVSALRGELEMLGCIAGRDLLAELGVGDGDVGGDVDEILGLTDLGAIDQRTGN